MYVQFYIYIILTYIIVLISYYNIINTQYYKHVLVLYIYAQNGIVLSANLPPNLWAVKYQKIQHY